MFESILYLYTLSDAFVRLIKDIKVPASISRFKFLIVITWLYFLNALLGANALTFRWFLCGSK